MAVQFNVEAGSALSISLNGGAYATLGYFGANGRPEFIEAIYGQVIQCDTFGDEIADVVYTGRGMTINCTLVQWDETILTNMRAALPGAAAEGQAGTIGTLWRQGSEVVGVKFTSPVSGRNVFTFASCILNGEPIRVSEQGITPSLLGLSFNALRTLGGSTPAATDVVFTRAAV